jgi:uncharacterized damage-inducible protein DinB
LTQAKSLADALQGLLSNTEASWFTPISIGIQGITAEKAAKVPAERFNSVWALANHLRFWQEFMLLRLQKQTVDRQALGDKNGWSAVPQDHLQDTWEKAKERMLSANKELADFIDRMDDDTLNQPISPGKPSPYKVIQAIIAHNSYHTCEIISIRHMLGLWLERT